MVKETLVIFGVLMSLFVGSFFMRCSHKTDNNSFEIETINHTDESEEGVKND